jgi:hypothetical protein
LAACRLGSVELLRAVRADRRSGKSCLSAAVMMGSSC